MFQVRYLFMAALWTAASYPSGGVSLCRAGSARRVMVPCGSTLHLEPQTIPYDVLSYKRGMEEIIFCEFFLKPFLGSFDLM